ncbi:adenylate/guanylate cyclase domain-containing protein [Mucilaginibacter sp.]|uniref:adenylate/guanylate cyclase domain-containing protein n=1 Tax=Mucilaginibacter sp. TaxID=1882438 RepID=UPI00262EEC8C|nr:adenylate/guanylate cyclase domain-containing protein [Mucilaginibacter sp.]MDB5129814.1 Adenylate and Guanylate cyclase catalytic protein [Mucilaginibacter sp.]
MDIYSSYADNIRSAIANDRKSGNINLSNFSGIAGVRNDFQKAETRTRLLSETQQVRPLSSLQNIVNELGLHPNFNQQLGLHPDFAHLKNTGNIEKHYIHSMFIDIKGSTHLFKRYEPETVLVITNTIQRAAIHTCMIFDGYIQRLHGDGMFVYFGGKSQDPAEAAKRCLTAASLFTYFVKNDLKEIFTEQGIETIFTRIGIDYGKTADVVWAMAGMAEISEVTTCSLHTSLAAKMQMHAESNGVVVGDNIKTLVPTPFYSPVCGRPGKENNRYIFTIPEENFYYTQHDFNWLGHLKSLDYISTNPMLGTINLKRRGQEINVLRYTDNLKPIAVQSKPYLQ